MGNLSHPHRDARISPKANRVAVRAMLLLPAGLVAAGLVAAGQGPSARTGQSGAYSISGVVLDPTQAAIVGANVSLYSRGGKNLHSTSTGPEGTFRFDDLMPDSYEIQVQHQGFRLFVNRVKLDKRAPAALRIVLELDSLHQEINVGSEGQLSTDAADNMDVTKLDRRFLESLPILGNNVLGAAIASIDPVSMGGAAPTIVVDGVETKDLALPASAIQEIHINQNPYSAEFSSPGQSRIQITTKSGSSHYHGSLDTEFRDYLLDARNAFAVNRPPERHLLFDGYLGGPLGKTKKTTFQLSFSREQDDLQSVVYALTPGGTVRENFPSPELSEYFTASIDRPLTSSNTLGIRYMLFNWSDNGQGVGGFSLPEAAANHSSRRHYLYVTDKATLSAKLVNELSARLVTSDSTTTSLLTSQPSIIVLGAFTGGSAGKDQHQTQNYLQLNDTVYWSYGNHAVKAGVEIPQLGRQGLNDRTNFNGAFQFSSLTDYLAAKPFSFTQQQGNPRLIYWQKELGLFVQDDWHLRPNLSVGFGLRYDWESYVPDHNNFAPRISIAFAPGKSAKTVFRAGAGFFYQSLLTSAIADTLRLNGNTLRQIVLTDNVGYPNPFSFGSAAAVLPSGIVRFEPGLRLPYKLQYSFGVERKLYKSTTVTATYMGSRGAHLFRSRDINAPLPPLFLERPNAAIGTLRQIESSGDARSDSLKLGVRANWGRLFEGMAQYTLARSYDDTSGINSFPANQYSLLGEWSRSDFDVRNTLSLMETFHAGRFFELAAVLSARSGRPYTMTTGTDDYNDTFANARPAGVPRNSLEGPGASALDLRLSKEFVLPFRRTAKSKDHGPRTTISLDAFNVLNRVNFAQFVGDLSSPFFGHPVEAGPARRIQLSLGVKF